MAEVKVDLLDTESAAGLFVRLADVAAGGAGEDSMLLCNWRPWNVGSIFWPTNDGVRTEHDTTDDGDIGAPYKYMRVERRGANFYWSRSTNGTTWEVVDTGNPMVREDMNVATLQVGVIENFSHWNDPPQSVQFEYVKILEEVVTLSGPTSVAEGGSAVTITVDLVGPAQTAPVDIVITEVSADANDLLLDGAQSPLTVSFAIGETQKTFSVQAIDDDLAEGAETIELIAASSSTDTNYSAGHPDGLVAIDIVDNDAGSVEVDLGDGLSVSEDGATDTFDVWLSTMPAAGEVVTLTMTSAQVTCGPVVFDDSDYSTPQTVTVTAIDDEDSEEDPHQGTITSTIGSAGSADPIYSQDLSYASTPDVTIQENDCGGWGYAPYDYNEDCIINLGDLAVLASQWSQCTMPYDAGCIDVR